MRHIDPKIFAGAFLTKDSPIDAKTREDALIKLSADLSDATGLFTKFNVEFVEQGKLVKNLQESVSGKADAETVARIEKSAADFADKLAKLQACEQAIETIRKEMDQPLYNGGKDLADSDRKAAIELQRRAHIHKGGEASDFKADMDNLVPAADYRSAALKMMQVGLESKARVYNTLSEGERKAFDAASMDVGFFSPELLGIETDCNIECASLLDLYDTVNVSKSSFKYPHVQDYGAIGQYDCDAKCDAEYGPEGNIQYLNGSTYDFRGVFCFNKDVLRESNYDLLGFMMRAAARSYRINRNRALISGDGRNEPLGWLTSDCFAKIAAPGANPTHQDLRQFLASAPVEYGDATAVMNQNVFAYFASMVDAEGRFIFGDNLMGFSPRDVKDRIRISNCLPDPTEGGTKGSATNPFDTGAFIMASGVWNRAYTAVNQRPMVMEQFVGGSSMWCVKYQFGAKDGGFVACCPAARTFIAG